MGKDKMKTYRQSVFEAFSQLIKVLFFGGDPDEMLSSYSWRTQNKTLISTIDYFFGDGHCKESYKWEKEHYNLDRFK